MAIKTVGGFEVEVLETFPEGLEWKGQYMRGSAQLDREDRSYPLLRLRRKDTGAILPKWEKWGIRADGGDSEIAAAKAAARAT